MSLSFVSSAVLTSTDGVSHNEEKAVETTEAESVRRSQSGAGSRPLFEQLRANRDAAEEEKDAAAKALRGTRTLDEEDCAHLDAIEKRRLERDMLVRAGVEDEVAAFRAARADRRAGGDTVEVLDDEEEENGESDAGDVQAKPLAVPPPPSAASVPPIASIKPKIMIKKKRRRKEGDSASGSARDAVAKRQREEEEEEKEGAVSKMAPEVQMTKGGKEGKKEMSVEQAKNNDSDSDGSDDGGGGLGGLLGGYGSESDSD